MFSCGCLHIKRHFLRSTCLSQMIATISHCRLGKCPFILRLLKHRLSFLFVGNLSMNIFSNRKHKISGYNTVGIYTYRWGIPVKSTTSDIVWGCVVILIASLAWRSKAKVVFIWISILLGWWWCISGHSFSLLETTIKILHEEDQPSYNYNDGISIPHVKCSDSTHYII